MKSKTPQVIFYLCFMWVNVFAQNANQQCRSLRYPFYKLKQVDSIGNISYAGNKSVSDFYSANDSLNEKCIIGTGCDSSNNALVYDVYYPSPSVYKQYNTVPLPAIIIFHSGGFSDCSNKERDSTRDYCKSFARRGFVIFNVEYRRGRLTDGRKLSPEQLLATYRAVQDGNGAIRSIVKRQIQHETVFKFDTSKIFLAGSSAGAILALHIAFCNQAEINRAYPGISSPNILGRILRDDYYGALNISFSVKGVLSMWGALVGSGSDSPNFPACITATDKIPVIAFQGEQDRTVPDSTIKGIFSSGARATAVQCGFSYHLTSAAGFDYQYATIPIYNRLQSLGIPSELYLDSDAGHGLDSTSDYGLSTNNTDSVEDYIAARAAIFFQEILNNTAGNLKQTLFVDTEDTSTNCDNLSLAVAGNNAKKYNNASLINIDHRTVMNIYPVPAKNILHIEVNGEVIVALTNQDGRIIIKKTINHSGIIDVSKLPVGIYYLKNNTTGETKKIVVFK